MWVGLTYSGLPKAIFESPFNISLRLTRTIFCFWFVVTCRNSMLSVYLKVLKHYDWILENCSCTEESNTQPWISIVHYDLSNPQQDWGIRRCYYQGCLCPAAVPTAWFGKRTQWTELMTWQRLTSLKGTLALILVQSASSFPPVNTKDLLASAQPI